MSGAAPVPRMRPCLSSIGHLDTYWGEMEWLRGIGHTVSFIDEKVRIHSVSQVELNICPPSRITLTWEVTWFPLVYRATQGRAEVKLVFHLWISEALFYLYIYLIFYLFFWSFFFFFFGLPLENSLGAPALFSKRDVFPAGRPHWAVHSTQ